MRLLNLTHVAPAPVAFDEVRTLVFIAEDLEYEVDVLVLFLNTHVVTPWFWVPLVAYVGVVLCTDFEKVH